MRRCTPPEGPAAYRTAMVGLCTAAIAVIALVPLLAGPGVVLVAGSALVYALLALSLNFVLGTTGLVSFGHAAYFGIGAYTLAILVANREVNPLLALAVAPVVGAAFAFVGGIIALRATEIYFALLTLALAQVVYVGAFRWSSLTGGSDGKTGAFAPDALLGTSEMYWFLFAVVFVCGAVLYILTRSPFGAALRGIRENRIRSESIGLAVKRYELVAFVISGTFSAIAGALFAMSQLQAFPGLFFWTTSALPVIMALLGGIYVFLGPVVGAFFYVFLNSYVGKATASWDIIIGTVVILIALALPSGIGGAVRDGLMRVFGKAGRDGSREEGNEPPVPSPPPERVAVRKPTHNVDTNLSSSVVLNVEGVAKRFGAIEAVRDVSFDVRAHSMHAIIGPNGAGKSTLFNLITGLVIPDQGRISFEGEQIDGLAPWQLAKRGLGRSFQQTNVFWGLTVLENVELAAAAARHNVTQRPYGSMPNDIRAVAISTLRRANLLQFASIPARDLSHGDQRSLELATAEAIDARMLLLDEPTAGLSPSETGEAIESVRELAKERGLTVLFVEHDMEVVFSVADRITVMHEGTVLADGPPSQIRANRTVQTAYLGDEESES